MRLSVLAGAALLLSGCGSVTLPAAVQMADGTALVGTTTAAISGGHFTVATADQRIRCSGTYDALDQRPSISVPVTCTNGLTGNAIVTRSPDGMSGSGIVQVSDGSVARVAFGNNSGAILAAPSGPSGSFASVATSAFPPSPSPIYARTYPTSTLYRGGSAAASTTPHSGSSSYGRTYTGNCPTPESLDAAGRRCGARSAASRPGGYDGYGTWAKPRASSGGSTYVRGHYRNGSWVSGHYRRRR